MPRLIRSAKTGRVKGQVFEVRGTIPDLANVGKDAAILALPAIVTAVKEQAKEEAPKKRGLSSKKSIVSRIGGKVRKPGIEGVVWSNAPHSHLIELGTKAHSLAGIKGKKKGKVMRIFGSGDILRRSAQHPGSRANPYMERAIPNANRQIEQILQKAGDKVLQDSIKDASKFFGDLKAAIT